MLNIFRKSARNAKLTQKIATTRLKVIVENLLEPTPVTEFGRL